MKVLVSDASGDTLNLNPPLSIEIGSACGTVVVVGGGTVTIGVVVVEVDVEVALLGVTLALPPPPQAEASVAKAASAHASRRVVRVIGFSRPPSRVPRSSARRCSRRAGRPRTSGRTPPSPVG